MKTFIHTQLKELLYSLKEGFNENELAYLSSQTKNEQTIRDKIAWRLHCIIRDKYPNDDKYIVRREWTPHGFQRRQGRVDLAILQMDEARESVEKVIALIEFKAQSITRRETWYLDEFKHDIQKMRGFVKDDAACKDADLYFIFLETIQSEKAEKFKSELAYAKYQTKSVRYYNENNDDLSYVKSQWNEFQEALDEHIDIPEPNAVRIGEAFGYEQFVLPLLIGPLK